MSDARLDAHLQNFKSDYFYFRSLGFNMIGSIFFRQSPDAYITFYLMKLDLHIFFNHFLVSDWFLTHVTATFELKVDGLVRFITMKSPRYQAPEKQ